MPLVTYSDFVELNEKLKAQNFRFFIQKLNPNSKKRTALHWNAGKLAPVNWWNIPLVRARWNQFISGDKNIDFAEYIFKTYLSKLKNPKILSVGCGTGSQEISIAKLHPFASIIGMDLAVNNIRFASEKAKSEGCKNTMFITDDFDSYSPKDSFDFIIFHSSLHHMMNVKKSLLKAKQLMHEESKLIILEYTGPNRINWSKTQLNVVNNLLLSIPLSHKRLYYSKNIKKKQSAPGLLRMLLSDPSEAPQSELILDTINTYFKPIELKGLGGNILAPLLKGISHHFIDNNKHNQDLLLDLFYQEDQFLANRIHDHYFGVFAK